MNNTKRLMPLIALLIATIVLGSLVIGYVIGSNVNHSHVQAAMPAVNGYSANAERMPSTLHYEFYPFFTVLNRCSVQQPIKHNVHIYMNIVRTNVHDNVQEEDNNNNDVVDITTTATPVITNTQTPVPTATSTPVPTSTPMPTAVPTKQHCDNGVGNGPDCPPPGHDKDNDGQADTPKGNNDDDESTLPCGDPGNPCNKSSNKDFMMPAFVITILIKLLNKNGYSVNKMSKETIDYSYIHPMDVHFEKTGHYLNGIEEERHPVSPHDG